MFQGAVGINCGWVALRAETAMTVEWIARRLQMGSRRDILNICCIAAVSRTQRVAQYDIIKNPFLEPLTGDYYFGHRYYNPNLQRWLNRDPLGEAGGINLYDYVGNNPVNWVDSNGHIALVEVLGGVAILSYEKYKGDLINAQDGANKIDKILSDPMNGDPNAAGPDHWKACAIVGADAVKASSLIPGTSVNPYFESDASPLPDETQESLETAEKLGDAAEQLTDAASDGDGSEGEIKNNNSNSSYQNSPSYLYGY